MMSPEQMRKKSLSMAESLRHTRYNEVKVERAHGTDIPVASGAIQAAASRVNAATAKEEASIGKPDPRPNNERY